MYLPYLYDNLGTVFVSEVNEPVNFLIVFATWP